jgi:hypothetical protein
MLLPVVAVVQGMYHVATLRLCQTLDELGLSATASALEVSLGHYWQLQPQEEEEAAQQVQLQVVHMRMGSARYYGLV